MLRPRLVFKNSWKCHCGPSIHPYVLSQRENKEVSNISSYSVKGGAKLLSAEAVYGIKGACNENTEGLAWQDESHGL